MNNNEKVYFTIEILIGLENIRPDTYNEIYIFIFFGTRKEIFSTKIIVLRSFNTSSAKIQEKLCNRLYEFAITFMVLSVGDRCRHTRAYIFALNVTTV